MNTMINLTKKPTNLFTPNPFNIFKLLSYYSDIDQSNSFLKMENKPIMDIVELFNMDKNGNRIFDYNEDTVLIREKNICLTNEEKVDKKLYFVKGVKLARPRNEINVGYCNPLSFLYMENHGAASSQLGIIIIFIDIIIEDFSRLFSIIKHDKIDEFIDNIIMFTHRTLQQKYFGLLLKSIEKFAEKTHYDGRNKCSVETAKKIMELMKENNLPTRMPLI